MSEARKIAEEIQDALLSCEIDRDSFIYTNDIGFIADIIERHLSALEERAEKLEQQRDAATSRADEAEHVIKCLEERVKKAEAGYKPRLRPEALYDNEPEVVSARERRLRNEIDLLVERAEKREKYIGRLESDLAALKERVRELDEALNDILDTDGARGTFDALENHDAKQRAEQALNRKDGG